MFNSIRYVSKVGKLRKLKFYKHIILEYISISRSKNSRFETPSYLIPIPIGKPREIERERERER